MSYTSYIKRVLSYDFQITSENGNIDVGGRILKENCLLLQFTSIFSCTFDAKIKTHDTPMHTDGGNVFEIFLLSSSFEIIQILFFVILHKNTNPLL